MLTGAVRINLRHYTMRVSKDYNCFTQYLLGLLNKCSTLAHKKQK